MTINTTGIVTTSDITINDNIEVVGVMTARTGGKFVGNGFNITNHSRNSIRKSHWTLSNQLKNYYSISS